MKIKHLLTIAAFAAFGNAWAQTDVERESLMKKKRKKVGVSLGERKKVVSLQQNCYEYEIYSCDFAFARDQRCTG